MQYLSQRLATESAAREGKRPAREGERPAGGVGAAQRERILAAVERLIGERGCAGTTIEAIVEAAGVSSVTFYEHFEDKDACLVAAFDRAVEETRARLREAAPQELPWPERVRAALAALLEAIDADPDRARMCLVEAQMGGSRLRGRYEATLAAAVPALRRGRALDSAPSGLPETLEEATVGGLAWLLRQRLELEGGGGVEDLYPLMVDIALSPYLGDGGAPLPAAEPLAGHG